MPKKPAPLPKNPLNTIARVIQKGGGKKGC
jgi:hypothetical protein